MDIFVQPIVKKIKTDIIISNTYSITNYTSNDLEVAKYLVKYVANNDNTTVLDKMIYKDTSLSSWLLMPKNYL